MSNYSEIQRRKRSRRRQRVGLIRLIGILSAVLVILVLVLLLGQGRKVSLHPELTMEAGGNIPAAQSFLAQSTDAQIAYSNTAGVKTDVPGVYDVMLTCKDKAYTAKIRVVDTVAPTGKVQDLSAPANAIPEASDFVTEMTDATAVTVSYLTQPDNTKNGAQAVIIVLTDAGGNTTQLQATLTLTIDLEAPVITGVADKFLYVGDTISYMSGVAVTDNMDTEPTLDVDRSKVDLSVPGEYTVIYTATDSAGNTTKLESKVTVLEKKENYVSYETIYQEVDAILAQIIEEDMTLQKKVWAVYVWIRTNCTYVNHSEKDDWMQAAYLMMTERKGDCFNYYALCKLMLDRLEIPNMDVRKVKNYEGDSDHYWSLVSLDGGNTWYHVDTTPRTDPASFCLVTDKFMDDYSATHGKCFNRDKSLYPATPEEDL